MKSLVNISPYQYALILCLSVALLFSQTFQAHMHLQHAEVLNTGAHQHQHEHVVDLHIPSPLQTPAHDSHHPDAFSHHQYHAEVDISVDSVAKKFEQTSFSLLFFFVIGLFLFIPLIPVLNRYYHLNIRPFRLYSLITPPLRAPPRSFPV